MVAPGGPGRERRQLLKPKEQATRYERFGMKLLAHDF